MNVGLIIDYSCSYSCGSLRPPARDVRYVDFWREDLSWQNFGGKMTSLSLWHNFGGKYLYIFNHQHQPQPQQAASKARSMHTTMKRRSTADANADH